MVSKMADNLPYPPAYTPEPQGVGYGNQSFEPDASKAYPQPPHDPQQYPAQPATSGTAQYYPNPTTPVVYGAQPYNQQLQMSQQTTAVIVGQPQVVIQQVPVLQSYSSMITLACLVFWFCNWLFGLIAFILAVVAENTKYTDPEGARKLGKASMWTSIAGVIASVVIVAIVVGVSLGSSSSSSSSRSSSYTYYYG